MTKRASKGQSSGPEVDDGRKRSVSKYDNLEPPEEASAGKKRRMKAEHSADFVSTTVAVYDQPAEELAILTDDERLYLRAIKVDLEEAVNRGPVDDKVSEEVADDDDDDDDDGPSRYGAIFQHIKGQEVAIAKDKELSFVLEYLLKLTGVEGIHSLVSTFMDESEKDANLLQNLACHSCASHIVECIFECLARNTAKVDDKLLRSFVTRLLLQPQILTDNVYAAHVIEKMLLRICRVLHYEFKNSQLSITLYDSKSSSEFVLTYNKDDSAKSSGLQNDMLSKSERRNLNAAISAVERIFLDESTGAVKTESVVSGCKSASGSVILQSLLVASRMYELICSGTTSEVAEGKKRKRKIAADMLMEILADKYEELSLDRYGSRLMELTVAVSSPTVFGKILNTMSNSDFQMTNFLSYPNSNHVFIRVIEFCTDMSLLLLLTNMVCSNLSTLSQSGHWMVLVRLVQKLADEGQKKAVCGRHGSATEWNQCQKSVLTALKNFYGQHGPNGWNDDQKRDYFVIMLGALQPKNFRKDPQETVHNLCMPGSQILQALCHFKEAGSVTNSFLKLNTALLVGFCSNNFGSFAVEKVLQAQKGNNNFYRTFLRNLKDVVADLACTKTGSRIFDSIWKSVDPQHRQELVEKLVPSEEKLRTNEFGRFIMNKINLPMYRRSLDGWKRQQATYDKQRDDLKAILRMTRKI
ncbi:hypothetical protein RvY_13987 [Ramazzottius varieornatus]|uniref:Nucleolar protein 9 n=1 Tax=Ramazzottius varieornatus TaxID=947166 RepID=A0A1D1VRJ2_RAMVA|nr:hypothetical protein RvY_13987 [Ramazzottius varieornatus]